MPQKLVQDKVQTQKSI